MSDKNVTTKDYAVTVLRLILGVVFFWFGLLQLAGLTPVVSSIDGALSVFAIGGISLLGFLEAIVGLLLLIDKFRRFTEVILVSYILLLSVALILHIETIFASQFFQLTAFGELIIKDIVMAIAGVLVLTHEGVGVTE